MKTVGIICEYNPFHLGHQKQLDIIRREMGADCAIVCLMSGSFVQRGMPAIFDKSLRAKAALLGGADLVLEMPVTYALSSAEGFAAGGVKILSGFCDALCFGTETGTKDSLTATAEALLSPEFPEALREFLDRGLSFPAARAAALGEQGALLQNPNDILAVEYCKAILVQNSAMEPMPIYRQGSYHAEKADPDNPSATAVRALITNTHDWSLCIPHDFEALPSGSEGLWRKFMHACRSCATLEDILAATKSKRYTRTRLDRMVMCAFLGITKEMLAAPAPYTRVLALNDTGREILKNARMTGAFPHVGESADDPYWLLEQRCDDLYGLFSAESIPAAGREEKRRVFYTK